MNAHFEAGEVAYARLDDLDLSDLNPRHAEPAPERVEAMAQSIRYLGVIQPLIVHRAGDDAGEKLAVVAGGIRLRALRRLAERGDERAGEPVPVRIFDTSDAALVGRAEQAAREPLAPVDEFRAYSDMIGLGGTVETVAGAFAQTPRYVRQRLALAALPAPALAALAAGEIPLYLAETLAATGDQAAALWRAHADKARSNPTWAQREIRAAANFADRHDTLFRRLETVGREAYAAEGGRLEENLFGEELRILDPDALDRAETKRREARAAEIAAAHGFAEWRLAAPREIAGGSIIRGAPASLPEAEAARLQELGDKVNGVDLDDEEAERLEELQAKEDADEPLTEAEEAELKALLDRAEGVELTDEEADEMAALEARAEGESWTEDQRAHAVLCIGESWNGLTVLGAVVPPERAEAAIEAGVIQTAAPAAAAPAPETGWPHAVISDLRLLPADLAREQLLDKPDTALWLIARALVKSYGPLALSMTEQPGSGLRAEEPSLRAWKETGDDADLATFMARGVKFRNRLLACAAAAALRPHDLSAVAHLFDLDLRAHWTPDARLFARLTREQLVEIAKDLGADGWKVKATMKKGELVEALVAVFADPPAEIAAKVNAWLPPILRPKASGETRSEGAA